MTILQSNELNLSLDLESVQLLYTPFWCTACNEKSLASPMMSRQTPPAKQDGYFGSKETDQVVWCLSPRLAGRACTIFQVATIITYNHNSCFLEHHETCYRMLLELPTGLILRSHLDR